MRTIPNRDEETAMTEREMQAMIAQAETIKRAREISRQYAAAGGRGNPANPWEGQASRASQAAFEALFPAGYTPKIDTRTPAQVKAGAS